jgi:hypothetical protein
MGISIRRVQGSVEADAVFALRYDVYVDELGRSSARAHGTQRCVEEPLDHCSTLLAAFDGERVVGTLRTSYAAHCDLGYYPALYAMDDTSDAPLSRASITTRLVVAPSHRHTSLAYRLAAAAYLEAVGDGILCDYIDVFPARVPFFSRLGYVVHRASVVHPELGPVIVMRIRTDDLSHLERVRSPLLRRLRTMRLAA